MDMTSWTPSITTISQDVDVFGFYETPQDYVSGNLNRYIGRHLTYFNVISFSPSRCLRGGLNMKILCLKCFFVEFYSPNPTPVLIFLCAVFVCSAVYLCLSIYFIPILSLSLTHTHTHTHKHTV